MNTTVNHIRTWLSQATKEHTHMIVVCDTFDHEDYPEFVKKGEDAKEKAKKIQNWPMQRIMEVYDLALDLEKQLAETRAFHY